MNRVKSTTLSFVALALVAAGCHRSQPIPQAPQAVQTQRIQAGAAPGARPLRFSATVVPDAVVPVSFRVPGYVTAVAQAPGEDGRLRDVAEGDRVRRGTVLARIRSDEYEDRVRQASSQAAAAEALAVKARLDFERARRLFDSSSLTRSDLDGARAQHDATHNQLAAARAVLSEAEIGLRDTSVVAAFDGEIVEKTVEPGTFVSPGAPVFVLARTSVVKIVVGVPDVALPAVRLGQRVEVTVDAFGDHPFEARITRIASAADRKTGNFEVEVAIENHDHALKVGMIGSLELGNSMARDVPAAVRVPLSAIVETPDGKYGVYLVSGAPGAQVARLRRVEVGPVVGSDITVGSGLGDGDEVISSGATLLKDGQKVEVIQ
jgi:multidrug efflux system membrane fusion protein